MTETSDSANYVHQAEVRSTKETGHSISDETIFLILSFLVPVLGVMNVTFMGQLLVSDMLIPILIVVAMIARPIPDKTVIHLTLAMAALWITALFVSDVLNQTTASDYLRGWARNWLGCAYLFYFLLTVRATPWSLTVLASGLVFFLMWLSLSKVASLEYYVKFGGGLAVSWIICIAAMWGWRIGKPLPTMLALFVWMLVALSQNVRSIMTIDFVVLSLMIMSYYGNAFFRRLSIPAILAMLLVAGGVAGYGLATVYGDLAGSGALGRSAQMKYLMQSRGNNLETVWNARPELRVASAVIADSPVLGHGSWYHDPKIAAAELLFSSYADVGSTENLARGLIVTNGSQAMGHSAILQAWVEAGIIGAFFWLWVIGVCITAILRALQHPNVLSPMLFLAAVPLIWDSLFSPFAGTQRVNNMAELAIVLLTMAASSHYARKPRAATKRPAHPISQSESSLETSQAARG